MSIPLGLGTESKMKRSRVCVWFFSLFFLLCISPGVSAGECSYGSVHAWFQQVGEPWVNATAHPCLKRGEVFTIQVEVKTKTSLGMFFIKLHEFGTPVYEVVDGPTQMEELLGCRQEVTANQTFLYRWVLRVRPETSWVNGYAPLEVFVQLNTNDADSSQVDFDVMTAFIVDAAWKGALLVSVNGNLSSEPRPGNNLPGFDAAGLTAVMFFLSICWRKKRRNSSA
jgi:sarcinarray family protein